MGYFHASKLLKLAFLSSLTRKCVIWKGFYHNFSAKKASASGAFAPWPPPRGSAPWTPEVPSPSLTIYPGATPVHAHTCPCLLIMLMWVGWGCVCIHGCMNIHSCMYMYVCMHVCVYFFMRLFMHAHALTRACTHTLTHHIHPKQACS